MLLKPSQLQIISFSNLICNDKARLLFSKNVIAIIELKQHLKYIFLPSKVVDHRNPLLKKGIKVDAYENLIFFTAFSTAISV